MSLHQPIHSEHTMKDPNKNRPGYKKTKAGWIPKEWGCCKVGDAGEVLGGRQRSPHATGSLRKYLRVANVLENVIDDSDVLEMPFRPTEFERYRLEAGDILLNEGQSLELVGRSAIYNGHPSNCAFQNTLIRFRVYKNNSVDYYQNLFLSLLHRGIFAGIASRTTSIAHLGVSRFSALYIPMPPEDEQITIATILTACQRAVELTRELVAAKKAQKKALMQKLLTGKKRLPGFKEKWGRYKIGELFKEVARPVDWDDNQVYSLLSVRRRSGGVFPREKLKGSQIATKVMFEAHAGDFLISKMQVLHGATALVPPELDGCHISGSYIALRPNGNKLVAPAFFARLSEMHEFRHLTYLCSYGVHIEKMTFNLEWFLDSKVLIPSSRDEQRAIVDILKAADDEINALESKLAALKEQKKGLMQKLLTGQIRVKI